MGFRFRKRIRLAKGLYLNIGKRGITSISKRIGRVTVTGGKRGIHEKARLRGGVSYTTGSSSSNQGCLFFALVLILALAGVVWIAAIANVQ